MERKGLMTPAKTPGGQRRYLVPELDDYRRKSSTFVAPQNPWSLALNRSANQQPIAFEEQPESLDFDFENDVAYIHDTHPATPPDPRNTLNELSGKEWLIETKSVWFQKGLGAGHPHAKYERQHPAPFSFQDVGRLISFFTKPGESVLDPFAGVGSTTKACALAARKSTSIELSSKWTSIAKKRVDEEVSPGTSASHTWHVGDARKVLPKLQTNSYDFVVTSPPYWAILAKPGDHKVKSERTQKGLTTRYSTLTNDLGNVERYFDFRRELTSILLETARVLRCNRYMALIVSDFRHKSSFISFHSDLIHDLNGARLGEHYRFVLQGTKILLQNHKKLYPYGYPFAYVENIHHQYILIFRKIPESKYQRNYEL